MMQRPRRGYPPRARRPNRDGSSPDMIPVIYHPKYNITAFGLERLHPFDGRKYRRIHDALIARGLREAAGLRAARADPSPRISESPHARIPAVAPQSGGRWPASWRCRSSAGCPAGCIDWRVLRPMRYATGGTILACRLALEHGLAINLGGGYHHAAVGLGRRVLRLRRRAPGRGKLLHDEGQVGRVLVVDLDAHQGNGTAAVFRGWPWASILDLYEEDIFPGRKEPEDYPLPVRPGLTGGEYLGIVRESLPGALDAVRPDW